MPSETTELVGGIVCGTGGCMPITEAEARALWDEAQRYRDERAARMPDEASAIRVMFDGYVRLKELGWREASYAPHGKPLELIEVGSTGVHRGYRDDVGFWIQDDDTWPSRPILYREVPDASH